MNPKQFQKLTIDAIEVKFRGAAPGRRFLLADEVGLGKTVVASGVIEKLCADGKAPHHIIYLCSSLEIADQNRKKLEPGPNIDPVQDDEDEAAEEAGSDGGSDDASSVVHVDRLTLFPLQRGDVDLPDIRVLCFTPGTSLKLEKGQGKVDERAFLLYLIERVFKRRGLKPQGKAMYRFFRCRAQTDSLLKACNHIREEITEGNLTLDEKFVVSFRERLKNFSCHAVTKTTVYPDDLWESVIAIGKDIREDSTNVNDAASEARNKIVTHLREELARAALAMIKPRLIILDEFQKFKTIIKDSKENQSLVGDLFALPAPVLMVSATPYKAYTTESEEVQEESHYDDFHATLKFLAADMSEADLTLLMASLTDYRRKILDQSARNTSISEIISLRNSIQEKLKNYIFRTERFPFLRAKGQGSINVVPDGPEITKEEFKEYFLLDRKTRDLLAEAGGKVKTHKDEDPIRMASPTYWKSGAYLCSYMGQGKYKTMARLCDGKSPKYDSYLYLPLSAINENTPVPMRNRKLRAVETEYLSSPEAHSHLWLPPTIPYFHKAESCTSVPKKLLVFSSWKFVPEQITSLLSHAVAAQLKAPEKPEAPLQIKVEGTRALLYPSVFLAQIDPADWSLRGSTAEQREAVVREKLERQLSDAGFTLGGSDRPTSALLFDLDRHWHGDKAHQVESAWSKAYIAGRGGNNDTNDTNENVAFEVFRASLLGRETIAHTYTTEQFQEMTKLCLGSPAIALLRSCMRLEAWSRRVAFDARYRPVIEACYGDLRNFFNKPLHAAAVRSVGKGQRYVDQVVNYCERRELQAVLDEFLYALEGNGSASTIKEATNLLADILGLRPGSLQVTAYDSSTQSHQKTSISTHFALQFGDYASNNEQADRKTLVRQAFNSPFWPFILASTSVGQEGLDFHLYCADILHWNLSSNPVDIEQREGRINRYNCLAVRQSLASDDRGRSKNWQAVFERVRDERRMDVHSTLEMFPNWIPLPLSANTKGGHIRRLFYPYPCSGERARYQTMVKDLATYRLALGQARQEELLQELRRGSTNDAELAKQTRMLMLNLMPIDTNSFFKLAQEEAARILALDEVSRTRIVAELITAVETEAAQKSETGIGFKSKLAAVIELAKNSTMRKASDDSLASLVYFLNWFDGTPDFYPGIGYLDDEAVLDKALEKSA